MQRDGLERFERLRIRKTKRLSADACALFERGQKIA